MRDPRACRHAIHRELLALTGGHRPVALVYRALKLGDLLTAVPALRALRKAVPEHRLVLATDAALRPLIPLIGGIDELWPARELGPLHWPRPTPDVAVNLHGRGPQSHQLLIPLRPGRLVAFAHAEAAVDGPPWPHDEHEIRRWCRLVESAWPVSAPADDVRLHRPATTPAVTGAVVVHPGASAPARRWPVARFAAVARHLHETGWPVVVTGSPAEHALADDVRVRAGLPAAAVLTGTTLDELAALIAHARLLISNDTGVAHFATAYGTPSVVLFGPISPAEWGPPASGPHAAIWHGGCGDPHGTALDPALAAIQVGEVVEVAESLLALSPE